ncbi:MAG: hypothetical protein ACXWHD_12915 [Candidatus Aminicenantales bacterium]
MPTPAQILEVLGRISNDQTKLAILWHALLAALIVALIAGWRPTKKAGATALAVPLLSVSVLAWFYGNPFNGTVFLLFAAGLAAVGMRLPAARVEKATAWAPVIGVLMVAFGWVYPHFFAGSSWLRYLYQAPTGLIPCPTLSAVIGLALLANGFSSRTWSLVLGVLGIFYSLFGAFRLGVKIDIVLLVGAVALLALARTLRTQPRR